MFKSYKQFALPLAATTALTVMQVMKAMNFPQGVDVSKCSLAILELGGAYDLKDVAAFCAKYKLTPPILTNYFVDGALESSSDADGEVCLDIDVAAAVAPGLPINVVFAPNTIQGFLDGVKQCIALKPNAISISWGGPIDTWDQESIDAMEALFAEAKANKIEIFAAAGDNGAKDGEPFGVRTDFPASSDLVNACGGTRLTTNADGTRASETAWSTSLFNSAGGGGGIAKQFPRPAWQSKVATDQPPYRLVPDISANADPATGYLVDIDGVMQQVGGTSAVAPLYAALYCVFCAMAGGDIGDFHEKLYSADASCFYDVTKGSNGAYSAKPGFDLVTGLGVMDATKFAQTALQLPTKE